MEPLFKPESCMCSRPQPAQRSNSSYSSNDRNKSQWNLLLRVDQLCLGEPFKPWITPKIFLNEESERTESNLEDGFLKSPVEHTLSLSLSLVWTVRKQSLLIQFVSWLIGYCKQTNLIDCRWNCAFQFLSKTSIIPSEIVDFISTALHVLLVLSLLFLREDIDGELTVRTCDFLQSNIWKKWREKQLHYFRRSRESSPHWSNHAVASGFVYNRCTLAGTHAPYFEVGVCLAPYLRDTVNDELRDFLHRKTFNFVRYLWNKWMLRFKVRNNSNDKSMHRNTIMIIDMIESYILI